MSHRPYEYLDVYYTARGVRGVDPCVYCGVISDAFDHVPPLATFASLPEREKEFSRLHKHPVCNQCNTWLGARYLLTLKERRKYILEKMRSKYKKFLQMPEWSEEELAELSGALADDAAPCGLLSACVEGSLGRQAGSETARPIF